MPHEWVQNSEEKYRQLLLHMPAGVAVHRIVLDEAGVPVDFVYLEMNETFASLVDVDRAEAIGKPVTGVIPRFKGASIDWFDEYGKVALDGAVLDREFYSSHLDRHFHVSAFSPEREYFVAIFTDVTGLARAREELRRANEGLEAAVTERTSDLRDANRRLARSVAEQAAVEEELRLFRVLMDQLSDALYVVDADTAEIVDVNLHACATLGYSRKELQGKRVWDISPSLEGIDDWRRHVAEVRVKGTLLFDGRHRHRDGTMVPVELNVKFIRSVERNYIVSSVRETVGRAGSLNATLLQTSMDGFLLADGKGKILDANEAYCNLSGYSLSELLSMNLKDVEANENPAEFRRHISYVVEHGFDRFPTRHRRKDGSFVALDVSASWSKSGGGRFYSFLRDASGVSSPERRLNGGDDGAT